MQRKLLSGNEAALYASYLFTEVAGVYPITPSSPMPALMERLANSGKKNIFNENVRIIEMQSEAGAIGMVHGSLLMGRLTSTYTSSQGLLLMIPDMYKIAGEMLPCTIHVAARSLATHALSILGDHQDIYAARSTGFCMLASSNVEDAYYMALISHLASIKSSLPFMHFFDGFRTSHEITDVNILEEEKVKDLIDYTALNKFRNRSLDINNPMTKGTNQNADIYFQITEARNSSYNNVSKIVFDYMKKINKITGKDYKPFNYYGDKHAKKVIVSMGSSTNVIKEYIDNAKGVGLIEVHLYRPFDKEYFNSIIPKNTKELIVLDRTKEFGNEPLYLDVLSSTNIKVRHGRYGLSSKDFTPSMVKAVFESTKEEFTVGIVDDVTNLSLDYKNINTNNHFELLLYGYGSDGMVSASKSLIEVIYKTTDKHVQGYFEYDSKKSGGVTASHLRFSDDKINSSYLVYNPNIVVISKDSYLNEFDCITNLKENGILIINTSLNDKELLKSLNPYKNFLNKKNISVYSIDAYKIADKYSLGRKISMIMSACTLKFISTNYNQALNSLYSFIDKKFSESIALKNKESVKDIKLNKIVLDDVSVEISFNGNIYQMINKRKGNDLKVSEVINYKDGTFKPCKIEKISISDMVPIWKKENCISCMMCSLVCPHGVIRPFLLNEDEYNKAPSSIKENCIKNKFGYLIISISEDDCTGCGVCINTCPGNKNGKALSYFKNTNKKEFNYLVNNVCEKNVFPLNTIKGSQLRTPNFAFHGACAGCGQTAYIKLLTQLFKNIVIANATGCSSIYGGALPSLPYNLPWANSLFEDNAEFSFGLFLGHMNAKMQIRNIMSSKSDPLFEMWLNNSNDYEITKKVYDSINYEKYLELKPLKAHIVSTNIWAIGGDGWAYDIGFSGIDHVLSSGENINILVLDSQVYSNTGGQASKATPIGAVAEFATLGKKTNKKDLARICMCYPNVYVGTVCLGANMMQTIKTFTEANSHNGPSIVIAYTPCISHGIKNGMKESINMEALAVKCGYFPIFRYDGNKFTLDSKNPNFDLYEEFLLKQTRYSKLKDSDLIKINKENAIKRFNYYKSLDNK